MALRDLTEYGTWDSALKENPKNPMLTSGGCLGPGGSLGASSPGPKHATGSLVP